MQLWACNGGWQQGWTWHAWPPDPAFFYITNDASGKCLDAEFDANGSPADPGDKVQLWTCGSGGNFASQQLWSWGHVNGAAQPPGIMNQDAFLSLDAENDANGHPSQNGDKVQLWWSTLGANQQFG